MDQARKNVIASAIVMHYLKQKQSEGRICFGSPQQRKLGEEAKAIGISIQEWKSFIYPFEKTAMNRFLGKKVEIIPDRNDPKRAANTYKVLCWCIKEGIIKIDRELISKIEKFVKEKDADDVNIKKEEVQEVIGEICEKLFEEVHGD